MKKIISFALLLCAGTISFAQKETKPTEEKKLSDLKAKAIDVDNIAQTDFLKKNDKGFTDVIINAATFVKNQQITGTC